MKAFNLVLLFSFVLSFLNPSNAHSFNVSTTNSATENAASSNPTVTTTVTTHSRDISQTGSVLTYHNDNYRTGSNPNETILNTSNVNAQQFGKLFSYPVDGGIMAQPLYVPNVSIPGQGMHNVVYVVTEQDSIYAFDADQPNNLHPLWHTSYISSALGITPAYPYTFKGDTKDGFGIDGTPAIDLSSNTMYLVAATTENGSIIDKLHALDITTGQDKVGLTPVIITATVPGTSADSVNGQLSFNPANAHNRPGLLLQNGVVYIAYSVFVEGGPTPYNYGHGWLFAYDASTFKQLGAYISTPGDIYGDFWGGAPAADTNGNIYVVTGNGGFDLNTGGADAGDSFLKLNLSKNITLTDYITPFNQYCFDEYDTDLGSMGIVLLPDQSGPNQHLMIGGGKEGRLYVINRDNLGQYTPDTTDTDVCADQSRTDIDKVVQETFVNPQGELFGTPVYWQRSDGKEFIYVSTNYGYVDAYNIVNGLIDSSSFTHSVDTMAYQGAILTLSSNQNQPNTGILWGLTNPLNCPEYDFDCINSNPGTIVAYDASDISKELYISNQNPNRDTPTGVRIHFSMPTVAGGKLFVGTSDSLDVYGLLNSVNFLSLNTNQLNFTVPNGYSNTLQSQVVTLTAQSSNVNWSSSINYTSTNSLTNTNWLNLQPLTGTISAGTSAPVSVTVNAAGLAGGTYTATVTISDNATAIDSVTLTVVLTVGNGYRYYLPMLANAAGGFTTYLALQNTGNSAASVTIQYYDKQGNSLGIDVNCLTLALHAECLPTNVFNTGQSGAGVVTSDQPLNIVVAEGTPYGGSAYTVSAGGDSQLVVPLIFNKAYGDFSTQLTVFNGDSKTITATVNFYDEAGNVITNANKTLTLAANTGQTLDQASADSNLPASFNGWALITTTGSAALVAQVLEQSPSQHFVAIAKAHSLPASSSNAVLNAPAIFNKAFGFTTGTNIVNPNSQAVSVTITYYDDSGTVTVTPSFNLPAHAIQAIFQGSASGAVTGLPTGSVGLPVNFSGSAIISSTNGAVVAIVNESGGISANGTSLSGIYTTVANGSNSIGLPVMAFGGYGYVTGATVQNISNKTVNASIQYYDVKGNLVGLPHSFTIAPYASQLIYQGDPAQGLPTTSGGFYGTAVVTESGGNQDLIVTTNAESQLFYTYTEPNA